MPAPHRLPSDSVLACEADRRVMANSARDFTAATDWLHIADNSGLEIGSNDFYVAGWVRLDAATANRGILNKWSEYLLWCDTTGPTTLAWRVYTSGGNKDVDSGVVPSTGVWYFVEAWYEDGVEINMAVDGVDATATAAVGVTATATSNGFDLGTYANQGSTCIDGRMSTWICRKGATAIPSAANRAWLYNGGIGRGADEIAAHATFSDAAENGIWGLQEDSGVAEDSGSNGYTLSESGTVTSAEGVTNDKAWEFDDASTDALHTGTTAEFQDTAFSLIWLGAKDDTSHTGYFVSKTGTAADNRVFFLYSVSAAPRFFTSETGGWDGNTMAQGAALTAGQTHLIVAEHADGSKTRISVDDETPVESTSSVTTIHNYTTTVTIGASGDDSGPSGNYLDGGMDYLLYVSRRMTSAERTWLYNGGSFRSLSDIQQAANNSNSPGTGIWANVKHAYKGGSVLDLVGSEDLTNYSATGTRSGSTTSRLLCDVSAAGVNMTEEEAQVYRWEDLSGEDNHPLQATYASQPLYGYGAGTPFVKAGTAGNTLACTFASSVTGGGSTAARGKLTTTWDVLFDGDASAGWLFRRGGSTEWYYDGGTVQTSGTVDANTHTFFANWDTTTDSQRVDGGTDPAEDTGTSAQTGITLFADYAGSGGHADTEIQRIALSDGIWTGAEVTDAEYAVEHGFYNPDAMAHGGLGGVLVGVD